MTNLIQQSQDQILFFSGGGGGDYPSCHQNNNLDECRGEKKLILFSTIAGFCVLQLLTEQKASHLKLDWSKAKFRPFGF